MNFELIIKNGLLQWNSPSGDTWETGSRSAICGGTTTIVAFALQKKEQNTVLEMVDEYSKLADGNSYCDYGIHLICTNPTPSIINDELPKLKAKGVTSVKLYMTYDPMKLGDRQILDVLIGARKLGLTLMIHAENDDMVGLVIETLEKQGLTTPYHHAVSRPALAESEATHRAISLSELTDSPILLVHVSSGTATTHIRRAQTRLLPIYAETCPQYLYLTSSHLHPPHNSEDHFSGAKYVCSPPPRDSQEDLDSIWRGLANGTFTTFSSDHAPSLYDDPIHGKKRGLITPSSDPNNPQISEPRANFRKIPNGLPGLETRLPLLFKGVTDLHKLSIQSFVNLTATQPANLYGLHSKGSLTPGKDADLCIWYPNSAMPPFELKNSMLHHSTDYTPYEGMRFTNWPRWTVLRGKVVWDRDGGGLVGGKGDGEYVVRGVSTMPGGERGAWGKEWRPEGV
ncbi:MAG: hypothetical protein Q9227_004978 [Pyrenula ochraceoflavens]